MLQSTPEVLVGELPLREVAEDGEVLRLGKTGLGRGGVGGAGAKIIF